MIRQSIRASKSIVLSIALGLVASAGLAGCGESSTEGEPAEPDVENVRVTAETIQELKVGEYYKVELTRPDIVYWFDYRSAPIDYSRVSVVLENRDTVPLEEQMAFLQSRSYGGNPQPDLLASPDQRFGVASDPADFEALDGSELAELESAGYYYKIEKVAPASSPQSTDDCTYGVCIICINPVTGEIWDWSEPGTPLCITEQHVWCD